MMLHQNINLEKSQEGIQRKYERKVAKKSQQVAKIEGTERNRKKQEQKRERRNRKGQGSSKRRRAVRGDQRKGRKRWYEPEIASNFSFHDLTVKKAPRSNL